tara:strand:+ start:121826 stop:122455 length:630 start_codon:yes stop_codon:yes gene_type:complete
MLPVDRNDPKKKFFQIFLYHVGRLLAYGIIGLLFGLLGKGLYLFGFQQNLSMAMGVVMIVGVLLPTGTFKKYNFLGPMYGMVAKVKGHLGVALQKKESDTFLTIGFLNGFLPCGLVYMSVFAAIAMGEAWSGSLYMVLFGVGTVPLMTTAIYFGGLLKGPLKNKVHRLVPFFLVLMGILFILRGLGLGIPYISPQIGPQLVSTHYECAN